MALYNCKCLYDYDKELIIEALMSYAENQIIPEGDLQNNKASRLREIAGFIEKTPTCPGEQPQSNTSFQQCMADKLRGREHQGRAGARAAFLKAASQCSSKPSGEIADQTPWDSEGQWLKETQEGDSEGYRQTETSKQDQWLKETQEQTNYGIQARQVHQRVFDYPHTDEGSNYDD